MEHSHKDLYSVLKVSRSASPEQIRSAYRELARAFHESANKEEALEASTEERSAFTRTLRDVTNAFNVLSNPVRRAEYDSQLAPLVDGQSFIPAQNGNHTNGSASVNSGALNGYQRRGRANETEFIALKPGIPVSPSAALKSSSILSQPDSKPKEIVKAANLNEMKVPTAVTNKRLPTKLMAVIVIASLSVGIVLAMVVKNMLYGG